MVNRKDLHTVVLALVAGMVGANAPAIAHGVHAAFSHNSDKVDGIHAAKATASNKTKKLIATDGTGKFPVSVIPKADADTLDGQDSTAFAGSAHGHGGADITSGEVDESVIDPDIARDSEITAPTTYTAGNGLDLSGGNEFSIDPNETQARVTGSCAGSNFVQSILANGTVSCGSAGDITGLTAGTGLSGGGSSGDVSLTVNSSVVQSRVAQTCSAGTSIRAIEQNGGVTCETDDSGPALATTGGENGAASTAARSDHIHDDRYINENPGTPESASISIDGTLGTTGLLKTGSRNTGEQPSSSFPNVVVRPLASTSGTVGSVVARTNLFRLQRDGTKSGVVIAWDAIPDLSFYGQQPASCTGTTYGGTPVSFAAPVGGSTAGSITLVPSTTDWVHLECAFGFVNGLGAITKVTLIRPSNNFYWGGMIVSSFNQ